MKLILCPDCGDLVTLRVRSVRFCECGASSGQYEANGHDAWYAGKAIPVGALNGDIRRAIEDRKLGLGEEHGNFKAFIFSPAALHYQRRA